MQLLDLLFLYTGKCDGIVECSMPCKCILPAVIIPCQSNMFWALPTGNYVVTAGFAYDCLHSVTEFVRVYWSHISRAYDGSGVC